MIQVVVHLTYTEAHFESNCHIYIYIYIIHVYICSFGEVHAQLY